MRKSDSSIDTKALMILSSIIFFTVCFFTYLLGLGLNIENSFAAIPVEKIEIIPSDHTINVGGSVSLIINMAPSTATDKTIKWSSSDTSVATVSSNGLVTGKKAGTVTITATASNGVKATAKITVKSKITPANPSSILVTGIELSLSTLSIEVDEESSVSVTITPDNATDKSITWTSDDPMIAQVASDGTIVGRKAGSTVITAKTSNGKTASVLVTVKGNEESSSQEPSIYIPKEETRLNVNTKLLITSGIILSIFTIGAVSYFIIKKIKSNY